MAVLDDVLAEEYARSLRLTRLMEKELASLPRGSMRARHRGNGDYYYLTHREGPRVYTDYVRADDVEGMRAKLARRKELEAALKEQQLARKKIERALGGRPSDE